MIGIKKNKKGQVAIYFVIFVLMILTILIASVIAPFGVLFNTEMYEAGEDILLRANSSIADIDDANVRDSIYSQLDQSFTAQENNIGVNNDIFQYSWILVIGLAAVVGFLFTRRVIEFGGIV